MEIDLNHAANGIEVMEKVYSVDSSGNGGDSSLSASSNSSNSSLKSSNPNFESSVYMELWHACAGPLTTLPSKGNVVVYFPQGHLEQTASHSSIQFSPTEVPSFGLQPQIFCKVIDVQLLANKENDEIYTKLTLLPLSELTDKNLQEGEEEGGGGTLTKSTPQMFCKTLTASDTSTHGGFSVPRRAAEDCFPPLDYKQQRPSQELVAKDLHGVEWKFRHIYRGQPRRHLLTTGWSIFVSQKNLISGDAVLFLRGEGGELRLGTRRATRPRNVLPDTIMPNSNSYMDILAPVANAVSTNTTFDVFYSPRSNRADFVVPYVKYMNCVSNMITNGTRFKMRFSMDESPERRNGSTKPVLHHQEEEQSTPYKGIDSSHSKTRFKTMSIKGPTRFLKLSVLDESSTRIGDSIESPFFHFLSYPKQQTIFWFRGTVTGVGDMDPYKWPKSKWRCLTVRWDEDVGNGNQERISPWEIDLSGASVPLLSIHPSLRFKKMRGNLHSSPSEHPVTAWGGCLDFEESTRSSKVLQGQENVGATINHPLNFGVQVQPSMHGVQVQPSMHARFTQNPMLLTGRSTNIVGELMRTHNQSPYSPYSGIVGSDNRFPKVLQGQEICSMRSLTGKTNGSWGPPRTNLPNNPGFYPLGSEGGRNFCFPNMPPVLPTVGLPINREGIGNGGVRDDVNGLQLQLQIPKTVEVNSGSEKDDGSDSNGSSCKLFGFHLNGGHSTPDAQSLSKRSCTKVHKQGNKVGRAIDLSKMSSYDELFSELEALFQMEGLLNNRDGGWRLLYTDEENDMMVVGDDPWEEFARMATKIHIYTNEEVEKLMSGGVISDDTSCLEEAPAMVDTAKSSPE